MKKLFILLFTIPVSVFACAHSMNAEKGAKNSFNPLHAAIAFYQGPLNHLSAVKKSECSMYPSCSEYGRQCIEKYGFFVGWMMTVDRLMRCGRDETKLSPRIMVDGKLKYYDPVEANDFWWNNDSSRARTIDSLSPLSTDRFLLYLAAEGYL